MDKNQALSLKHGDKVINTETNIILNVSINHVKDKDWDLIECKYIEPEYGWCNVNYQILELI